jgi:RNA polymerase sigma-70 factor (ECF subfamily)
MSGLPAEDVNRIQRVLYAAVQKVCPAWLANQKEDLVQAAFVRVFKVWKNSEESGVPSTSYVWKVAYSATVDEIRRARVRREEPLDETNVTRTAGTKSPSVEQTAAAAEMRREIVAGLRTLRTERRQAVQLYLSGFSLKDSARLLGWNTKKVDNRRYHGLADLRGYLQRRGIEP